MNKDLADGVSLVKDVLAAKPGASEEKRIVFAPPFIHLNDVSGLIKDAVNIHLSAQNCHQEVSGAYTGEISASMISSCGADYVIIGHSERREYFKEDEDLLSKKVDIALKHGLKPIFCCGEKLEIREAGNHENVVTNQIASSLFHLSEEQFTNIVIAYEPVWAIGTGVTASAEQAQEMHAAIRNKIGGKYGSTIAENLSILYGGSVKPDNAAEIFSMPDVDGGLIGGASLKADDFISIFSAL
jgi:triosephosphate isomerase